MAFSRIQQFELQLQHEMAQEQAEVLMDESPPALREKITWIRNYFEDEWRRGIVGRYQVAAVIREIYDDVTDNKGAVYGAKAVKVIKKVFGWDDGIIYQALHVADTFTPEQIENIALMRLPGGRPLSYSHVVALSKVEDEHHREKLLKQTIRDGWTAQKLTNAVDRAASPEPSKPPERRGRPVAKPRDFDAVLDQQGSFAQDFLSRNDKVWSHPEHSLRAKLNALEPADFTTERAGRLKRHAQVMSLLAEKAQERADEAVSVHKVFVRLLKEETARHKQLASPATAGGAEVPA
jgi:hypothetical protein